MTCYLDSSVLVAALVEDEPAHEPCVALLRRKGLATWSHALAEVHATLTGGRLGIRVPPGVSAQLIDASLAPRLQCIDLASADILESIRATELAGVRGGALFDFLHVAAARKAKATTLFTLDTRGFAALVRPGDPRVERPS